MISSLGVEAYEIKQVVRNCERLNFQEACKILGNRILSEVSRNYNLGKPILHVPWEKNLPPDHLFINSSLRFGERFFEPNHWQNKWK